MTTNKEELITIMEEMEKDLELKRIDGQLVLDHSTDWFDINHYAHLDAKMKQVSKYTYVSSDGYIFNTLTNKRNYGRDNNFGYLTISVGSGNNRKTTTMNNLVFRTFISDIPEGYVIHHLNHNPYNNNISNLAMITRGENLAERFKFNKHLGAEMASKLNRNYIYDRNSKTLYKNKKAVADSVNGLIAGVTACLDGRFKAYKGLDLVQLTDDQMQQLKACENEHDFLFFDKNVKMVNISQIQL